MVAKYVLGVVCQRALAILKFRWGLRTAFFIDEGTSAIADLNAAAATAGDLGVASRAAAAGLDAATATMRRHAPAPATAAAAATAEAAEAAEAEPEPEPEDEEGKEDEGEEEEGDDSDEWFNVPLRV
ncbi:hypothetical protein PG985_015085 [Apiospora marii]|uniref:uncharacterized protein n=1 Tax=Apiospora marii TaxID=335849 RepID=UPI0031311CAF